MAGSHHRPATWYREKLFKMPLFPYAVKKCRSLSDIKFSWFDHQVHAKWEKRTGGKYKPPDDSSDNPVSDDLLSLATENREARKWCWYLWHEFDRDLDDNVRPWLLPGYSGRSSNLLAYRRKLEHLRKLATQVGTDVLNQPVFAVRLALAHRSPRGPVFDIHAYILMLLFDALRGKPDARYVILARSFPRIIRSRKADDDRNLEKRADAIEKAIKMARQNIRHSEASAART